MGRPAQKDPELAGVSASANLLFPIPVYPRWGHLLSVLLDIDKREVGRAEGLPRRGRRVGVRAFEPAGAGGAYAAMRAGILAAWPTI